jgi:Uma2 family endonuclease
MQIQTTSSSSSDHRLDEVNPAPLLPTETRVLLEGVSWETFETLLEEIGDNRAARLAYDNGVLEIMSPYARHEEPKGLIESFIEVLADELDLRIRKLGSLTMKQIQLKKGAEPDSCYYIQNEPAIRGKEEPNLATDPPPDLVIEVDNTHYSLDKFRIYSALGVPEFWRYRGKKLLIFCLQDGQYVQCDRSPTFPILPIAEVPDFLGRSKDEGHIAVVRAFRARIREINS